MDERATMMRMIVIYKLAAVLAPHVPGVYGGRGPGGGLQGRQVLRAPHLLPGGAGLDSHGDAAVLVRAVLGDLPAPPRLAHRLQQLPLVLASEEAGGEGVLGGPGPPVGDDQPGHSVGGGAGPAEGVALADVALWHGHARLGQHGSGAGLHHGFLPP